MFPLVMGETLWAIPYKMNDKQTKTDDESKSSLVAGVLDVLHGALESHPGHMAHHIFLKEKYMRCYLCYCSIAVQKQHDQSNLFL